METSVARHETQQCFHFYTKKIDLFFLCLTEVHSHLYLGLHMINMMLLQYNYHF